MAEPLQRLVVIPHLVGGRAGIELNFIGRVCPGMLLQRLLEFLVRFAVFVLAIGIQSRRRCEGNVREKKNKSGRRQNRAPIDRVARAGPHALSLAH